MYIINNYPEILTHLKSLSRIFKNHESGWISMFCQFCDDEKRKANPTHGHMYVSTKTIPAFRCFRCGEYGHIIKLLLHTGFNNRSIFSELKNNYSNSNIIPYQKNFVFSEDNLIEKINEIKKNNNNFYRIGIDYLENRVGDVNPILFGLLPDEENKRPVIKIYNSSNVLITYREILHSNLRYFKINSDLYYFQKIEDIYDSENIVICEGIFDLINLYNYSPFFKDKKTFFIAINGNNFHSSVVNIIKKYLLLGNYKISLVFDKDFDYKNEIKRILKIKINDNISFNFFNPIFSKDVSELMYLEKINVRSN